MAASFHIPPITALNPALGAAEAAGPGLLNAASQDIVQTANNQFNLSGWFVRIGEILAGLVLIGIGLNAMLRGRPLQVVTSTAGLAAKAVPK